MPIPTPARLGAALVAAALTLPGCIYPYYLDGVATEELVLTELNAKVLPIAIEDDGDSKDVVYKSKSKYAPATVGGKQDRRLLLRGKRDGAALRAVLERELIASELVARVRFAFDPAKTDGLVDDTSLGFFELRVDGGALVRRIEAVYDADTGGYEVRATDGAGTPVGEQHDHPGASELVVQFRIEAGTLFCQAGPPTGEGHAQFDASLLMNDDLEDGPWTLALAWGAEGLGKKARLFANNFALVGPYPDIGTAETPIALALIDAYEDVEAAAFNIDVGIATDAIEAARDTLATVVDDLDAGLEADAFGDVTRADLAYKSALRAFKAAEKGAAVGAKLEAKGKTNAKPVQKAAARADKAIQLAIAQLAGFRSKSFGRMAKTGFVPPF